MTTPAKRSEEFGPLRESEKKTATPKNLEVAGVIVVVSLITTDHDRLGSSREADLFGRRSTAGIEAPDEGPVGRAGTQVFERKAARRWSFDIGNRGVV